MWPSLELVQGRATYGTTFVFHHLLVMWVTSTSRGGLHNKSRLHHKILLILLVRQRSQH